MNEVAAIINTIRIKVEKLTIEYSLLKEKNKELTEEIIELKRTINNQENLLIHNNKDKEVRNISDKLKTEEGKTEIIGKVEELIQDVDRCIDLIKAD